MTLIVYMVAFGVRTPIIMWPVAMLCDTAMVITYLLLTKVAA